MDNIHEFKKKDAILRYEDFGQKSDNAIVAIQGFGYCSKHFKYQIEELSKSHRLILINNRDMGGSKSLVDSYSMEDLAQDVIDLIAHLKLSKVNLLGISMGGFIAQLATLKAPHLIDKLILGCTTSRSEEFPKIKRLTKDDVEKAYQIEESYRNKMICMATVHPSKHGTSCFEDILKIRIENTPSLSNLLRQLNAVNNFLDSSKSIIDLESITQPTLLISGEEDRFVDIQSSKILKRRIPNSKLVLIPEADHHFFMEEPKKTNSIINQFISENICQ